MGRGSAISWTDNTFNPWWGCVRVSPGCENCYAEAFAKRTGKAKWGPTAERRLFGDKHWAEPMQWNRRAVAAGERERVFCSSMADVFEDRRDLDAQRARLWDLIAATPGLDWQLLTKRPQNMARLAPQAWADGWPANVWAGTTAEDQRYADERIPALLKVPARVRFVSYEPALGPVDLSAWLVDDLFRMGRAPRAMEINWVIAGGESGPGRRTCETEWFAKVADQCERAGAAFFMKQDGGLRSGGRGRIGPELWSIKRFPPAQATEGRR